MKEVASDDRKSGPHGSDGELNVQPILKRRRSPGAAALSAGPNPREGPKHGSRYQADENSTAVDPGAQVHKAELLFQLRIMTAGCQSRNRNQASAGDRPQEDEVPELSRPEKQATRAYQYQCHGCSKLELRHSQLRRS